MKKMMEEGEGTKAKCGSGDGTMVIARGREEGERSEDVMRGWS